MSYSLAISSVFSSVISTVIPQLFLNFFLGYFLSYSLVISSISSTVISRVMPQFFHSYFHSYSSVFASVFQSYFRFFFREHLKTFSLKHNKRNHSRINIKRYQDFPHDLSHQISTIIKSNYLENSRWKILSHPPYSPDLAPSDYHLFRPMQNAWNTVHIRTGYQKLA